MSLLLHVSCVAEQCGFACCLVVCLLCSLQSCSTSLRLPACWFPQAVCQPSLVRRIFQWYYPASCPFTLIAWSLLFSALVFSPFFCLVWSPTGIVLQTVYLWRHRSLPLVGVVSKQFTPCTPLNLYLNKYLFHSLCIWVSSCWTWLIIIIMHLPKYHWGDFHVLLYNLCNNCITKSWQMLFTLVYHIFKKNHKNI